MRLLVLIVHSAQNNAEFLKSFSKDVVTVRDFGCTRCLWNISPALRCDCIVTTTYLCARFEVFTAVLMKMQLLWDMTP